MNLREIERWSPGLWPIEASSIEFAPATITFFTQPGAGHLQVIASEAATVLSLVDRGLGL